MVGRIESIYTVRLYKGHLLLTCTKGLFTFAYRGSICQNSIRAKGMLLTCTRAIIAKHSPEI